MYVCTDRAQVCFNILSKRERKKLSFENPLVEKRKSSTSKKKKGLVKGLYLFSI